MRQIKRVLLVGYGSIGQRHLRIARQLIPKADIRVLRHKTNSEVPELSNGCFFSIEDALAFFPDIAVIASPAPFHIDMAKSLAEIGVHLLIEKPVSVSSTGVVELIEICRKKRLVLSIGYNLRFFPSIQRFRDLLDQRIVGKIFSVRCEVGQYLPSWRVGQDYSQGVSARSELGGGVLLELSHELDYLRWIFGEVVWVTAILKTQSNLKINVEDTAHLLLGVSNAVNGDEFLAKLDLDFIRHDATRSCVVIGEMGSLRWNGLTGVVSIYKVGDTTWQDIFTHTPQYDDSYIAEWKNFLECVGEGKTPSVTGLDGLKVIQIVEAVRKSASANGQMFKLEKMVVAPSQFYYCRD